MPFLEYSIAKITGWDDGEPELATPLVFDNLSLPKLQADRRVQVVTAPGVDYQGLRLGETRGEPIEAAATLFTQGVAPGFARRDALRALKPQAGVAYYGVWVVTAGVTAGPYDLLAADVAGGRGFRYLLNQQGALDPAANVRFDYRFALLEREPA